MIANSADEVLHIYTEVLFANSEMAQSFQILTGFYTKRIMVIVKSIEFGTLEKELLTKMLAACQLKEDDYYIAAALNESGLHSFVNVHNPEVVILFGLNLDTDMVKLNKPTYKPFRFNNIKMLLSDSLTKLNADNSLKSALWTNGLKPLFKI